MHACISIAKTKKPGVIKPAVAVLAILGVLELDMMIRMNKHQLDDELK